MESKEFENSFCSNEKLQQRNNSMFIIGIMRNFRVVEVGNPCSMNPGKYDNETLNGQNKS